MKNPVERAINNRLQVIQYHALTHTIEAIGASPPRSSKVQILFAGNGGSAADAQHLPLKSSADSKKERSGLAIGTNYRLIHLLDRRLWVESILPTTRSTRTRGRRLHRHFHLWIAQILSGR